MNARVTVNNELGLPVSGASVVAFWTLPDGSTVNQTRTTDSRGLASFKATGGSGLYVINITNITLAGYTFDPANSILTKSQAK